MNVAKPGRSRRHRRLFQRGFLLGRFNERRFLLVLIGLFAALAVPAAMLTAHAWRELGWQAFHQQRLLAEEFTARIDAEMQAFVLDEEARSFTDYAFLVVEGDPETPVLRRSPLSEFPVEETVPGLKAYFQVDPGGNLTTPLVPDGRDQAREFGVGARELERRLGADREVKTLFDGSVEVGERNSYRLTQQQARSTDPAAALAYDRAAPRVKRIEQNVAAVDSARDQSLDELVVTTFRSEVDPFDFRSLDADNFLLYRNVWRENRRFIQGALIAREEFVDKGILDAFGQTNLSRIAGLAVVHGGEVLSTAGGSSVAGYPEADLAGQVLLRSRLTAPLDGIELIYRLTALPPGTGSGVVLWTAGAFAAILVAGFVWLYRLGVGQIRLGRQQQDFVSSVSHELKSPLTSIRMYAEILRAGWADEAQKRLYYETIYDESERLSRLIANVLELSRLSHRPAALECTAVAVSELVDNARSGIESSIAAAGFELVVDVEDATVQAEQDAFTQVLINLTDNAVKFARDADVKTVEITTRIRDGAAVIAVRDYGPGVPRDQLRKIFRLFYRSENELTRETLGTGIGLALVRELVTAMGGEVDVVNRNPGAEFRIVLPIR
ncbi:MAG: HAMP domain-containing sensor histidine kinase [Gammaproteobacteria bacterium]|nr:HAMP domain-containing sensor histidine kinase [Gammaproteobacteria bacterium]